MSSSNAAARICQALDTVRDTWHGHHVNQRAYLHPKLDTSDTCVDLQQYTLCFMLLWCCGKLWLFAAKSIKVAGSVPDRLAIKFGVTATKHIFPACICYGKVREAQVCMTSALVL